MDDEEAQCNELLALESIFDEAFLRSTDEPGGEVRIRIQVDQPLSVSFEAFAGSNDVPEKITGIEVECLPPLVLNFSYPSNYPSSAPPSFALSCKWLNEIQLSELCKQLDAIWEDNHSRSVILFEWTSFLQEHMANVLATPLKFRDMAMLRRRMSYAETATDEALDKRAFQDVGSLFELRKFLIEYDNAEQTREFNCKMFDCNVCFTKKFGKESIAFHPCSHVFCNLCMAEYFKIKIFSGSVKALTCPFDNCDSQAIPNQVRNLVDDEVYGKYEDLLLQSSLDCMNDVLYCPRNICQSPVLIDRGSTIGRCPRCQFAFCTLCKRSYHGIEPCPIGEEEIKKLRMDYERACPKERLALEKKYGRRNLKYAVEDTVSEDWISQNSKKCPQCKAGIQKIDGCNKMTCFRCNSSFCWLCQQILSKSSPYSHFNNLKSPCNNKLFEGVIINDNNYFEEDFD